VPPQRRPRAGRRGDVGSPSIGEKLDFLRDPRHYPDASERVAVVETHFAWVFLTDRRAYKLKKALRHGTMDYRTLAKRERGCRQELVLNRRLAPSVYLRVLPLSRLASGVLKVGRGQQVVNWLIEMRRLPESRMLDRALLQHTVTDADSERLVSMLSDFFANARPVPLTADAYRQRLRSRIAQNRRDLGAKDLGLSRRRIDAVIRDQFRFMDRCVDALGTRASRLVDGHGDLRPEHLWLGPPSCVIDCIEFDADLRRLDPAEEIAFLALECVRLGAVRFADDLLRRYRLAARDPLPDPLFHFYLSQRAAVRARIAAWHLRDPRYTRRRPWIARAHSYLEDALRYGRMALVDIQRQS
jgi:aminoglycoside phosphotransferase family enzyme